MRKFQFSLEAALGMRERGVEAAEIALQRVQAEWNVNERHQQELTNEVRAAELAVVRQGPVDAGDLAALDRYRGAAQRQRFQMAQAASAIARRVAERSTEWKIAERDRALLERLKEKARARWQLECDKELQQLAEEAYLSRWSAR